MINPFNMLNIGTGVAPTPGRPNIVKNVMAGTLGFNLATNFGADLLNSNTSFLMAILSGDFSLHNIIALGVMMTMPGEFAYPEVSQYITMLLGGLDPHNLGNAHATAQALGNVKAAIQSTVAPVAHDAAQFGKEVIMTTGQTPTGAPGH